MEMENLTEKEKLSLMILMDLMDTTPEIREEFRELVHEQVPGAADFVDTALSIVEETEAKAKAK